MEICAEKVTRPCANPTNKISGDPIIHLQVLWQYSQAWERASECEVIPFLPNTVFQATFICLTVCFHDKGKSHSFLLRLCVITAFCRAA